MKLVNALLDFSRLEAGRLKGSFVRCNLAGLTLELAVMFQSAFDAAGLRLTIDCTAAEATTIRVFQSYPVVHSGRCLAAAIVARRKIV
jgi:signal transduction histidine kinase